jgi:16S rRNA (cytidine1402-2'-O)-methyltransferase
VFEGFLPAKSTARLQRLTALQLEARTMVFYEAPHRLLAMLQAMLTVFGVNRCAVVARELTKVYETVVTGTLQMLVDYFIAHADQQRGESVILVAGVGTEEVEVRGKMVLGEEVLDILLEELPLKQAVALASKISGERKNVLYEKAIGKRRG